MNFSKKAIQKSSEMESIAKSKMNCTAEHWLDVAFKLDYISLKEKEKIVSLIRKLTLYSGSDELPEFRQTDYYNLNRMGEIMLKTTLPAWAVKNVEDR